MTDYVSLEEIYGFSAYFWMPFMACPLMKGIKH